MMFYNNMLLQESIVFFGLSCCFKNINDVRKVTADQMLATSNSFSIYKMEHGFNAKGIHEFVAFASYVFSVLIYIY